MAKGVTFDYSKTSPFIRADEVELMKKLVGDATVSYTHLTLPTNSLV